MNKNLWLTGLIILLDEMSWIRKAPEYQPTFKQETVEKIDKEVNDWIGSNKLFESPVYLHLLDGSILSIDSSSFASSHYVSCISDRRGYVDFRILFKEQQEVLQLITKYPAILSSLLLLASGTPGPGMLVSLGISIGQSIFEARKKNNTEKNLLIWTNYILSFSLLFNTLNNVLDKMGILVSEQDLLPKYRETFKELATLVDDYSSDILAKIMDNPEFVFNIEDTFFIKERFVEALRFLIKHKQDLGYSTISILEQEEIFNKIQPILPKKEELHANITPDDYSILQRMNALDLSIYYLLEVKASVGMFPSESKTFMKILPIDKDKAYKVRTLKDEGKDTFIIGPVANVNWVRPKREIYANQIEGSFKFRDPIFNQIIGSSEYSTKFGMSLIKKDVTVVTGEGASRILKAEPEAFFNCRSGYGDFGVIGNTALFYPLCIKGTGAFTIQSVDPSENYPSYGLDEETDEIIKIMNDSSYAGEFARWLFAAGYNTQVIIGKYHEAKALRLTNPTFKVSPVTDPEIWKLWMNPDDHCHKIFTIGSGVRSRYFTHHEVMGRVDAEVDYRISHLVNPLPDTLLQLVPEYSITSNGEVRVKVVYQIRDNQGRYLKNWKWKWWSCYHTIIENYYQPTYNGRILPLASGDAGWGLYKNYDGPSRQEILQNFPRY